MEPPLGLGMDLGFFESWLVIFAWRMERWVDRVVDRIVGPLQL
jgi:hypothetical protein